jgi:TolB-like protein/DNA-binding winged helix-turn-helix (wHTH) protein/Tfp pilus assembly protein PilF
LRDGESTIFCLKFSDLRRTNRIWSAEVDETERLCFEEFALDLTRGCLRSGDRDIDLRPKAFAVLHHLAKNAGRLVPKQELYQAVWPDVVVCDDSLVQCIRQLRDKLGDEGHRLIKTVHRRGYLLDVAVSTSDFAEGFPTASASPVATTSAAASLVPSLDRGDRKARLSFSIANKPSIAVLPFQNMSGDPEQEYFADGMVEDIITGLSRFRSLFVIARNSSFTYKGRSVDVKQVGRELGVRYLLEGSVRKSANRIRISGQLIDASSGTHLWADRFEGAIEDVFELQDQVAASVVGAIAPRLQQAEIERARRKPTESLDAYDLLLRGLANVYKWTREGNDEALRLFYGAIEVDPDYSAAYASAAMCFTRRKVSGWVIDQEQEVAEARMLARRAVQLGKDDATVLCATGHTLAYVVMDLDDGAAFLERALLINPNLASGWASNGWVKVWLGEPDRAIESFAHAMRSSPLDPHLAFFMQQGIGHAHFFAGRYDEALTWAKMALRELPDGYAALRVGAASCALTGRAEEAKRLMARLLEIDPALRISTLTNVLGPYRNPEHPARYADALRKAGLPE